MTQAVLSQIPAAGMQNDAGASKAGSGRDNGAGNSRYDSVSRAEQKRLDRQQSGRNDDTRKTDSRPSEKNASAQPAGQAERAGKAGEPGKSGKAAKSESRMADQSTGGTNAESASDMEAVTTPLTFAELQALLQPATGQGVSNSPMSQSAELFAGFIEGKPGQAGTGGLMSGLQLTDALMPGAGKQAGVIDASSLLNGTRFESIMDMVAQQGSNTTNRLSAEAQVPLRGYTTSVDVPVNHAEWGDKLMGKLSWLTAKNLSVAEIHLTPPDMGPMEIRVRVQNEQANITVHASNPIVREQLELHSHRLRDMLGEQGLGLAQFDVSGNAQDQSGEQGAEEGDGSSSGSGTLLSGAESGEGQVQAGSLDLSWNGSVDVFV